MTRNELINQMEAATRAIMAGKAMYRADINESLAAFVARLKEPDILPDMTAQLGPRPAEILGAIQHLLEMQRRLFEKVGEAEAVCDKLIRVLKNLEQHKLALDAISFVI